jgi:hypothetical protein
MLEPIDALWFSQAVGMLLIQAIVNDLDLISVIVILMNELNWCWSKVTMFRATRMTCLCALLLSRTKASFVLLLERWLLERFLL